MKILGRELVWRNRAATINPMSLSEWASFFSYGMNSYTLGLNQTLVGSKAEEPSHNFRGFAENAYRRNGIVFACMEVRRAIFSEARFQFRQLRSGQPGDLFGTAELKILEEPWPGGTTGDLLSRAIQDVDLAGNFFCVRRPGRIKRMRPDWVSIILGSDQNPDVGAGDVDAEVLGYVYQPGGPGSGKEPEAYLREEVAHFAPIPDPTASFRGMSWLTPVIREVMADGGMTEHKIAFLDNGATPNLVVKLDPQIRQQAFDEWVKKFNAAHEGAANAYKTLFLGGGADATVVGSSMEQMTFRDVQGAGETRVAAAARIHPVIVGLSEGLQGSSLNVGNFGAARRLVADGTMRPLWRNICGSLATIIDVPQGAQLWYADDDIPFLQEDVKDAADIQQTQAISMRQLIDAGFEHDSVIAAITSGDLRRLKHTGLVSVQLLPPGSRNSNGSAPEQPALPDPKNGNGKRELDVEHGVRELVREVARELPAAEVHVHHQPPPLALPAIGVNVEAPPAPDVHVHTPAITVAAAPTPDVHVGAPTVNVEAAPVPDVVVHTPAVTVTAAPTPDVHVAGPQITVEAAPTPDVHVAAPHVTVEAAPAPEVRVDAPITVEPAAVTVNTPAVTVEAAAAPEVRVDAPITVEPAAVTVNTPAVTVEAAPAPDVHVDVQAPPAPEIRVEAPVTVHVPKPSRRSLKVKRDEEGRLEGVEEDDPEE